MIVNFKINFILFLIYMVNYILVCYRDSVFDRFFLVLLGNRLFFFYFWLFVWSFWFFLFSFEDFLIVKC